MRHRGSQEGASAGHRQQAKGFVGRKKGPRATEVSPKGGGDLLGPQPGPRARVRREGKGVPGRCPEEPGSYLKWARLPGAGPMKEQVTELGRGTAVSRKSRAQYPGEAVTGHSRLCP